MEDKTIKVLLIEDNPDDAELLQRKLAKSENGQFAVTALTRLKDGLEYLDKAGADLVLTDLGLPDSHGLDTVTSILSQASHTPLVVLSGFDDEALAIKAVQMGAQDYLVKGQITGNQLERTLFYAMERAQLHRELEQYAQELVNIQANLYKILEHNADAIIVVGRDRQTRFTNPAAEALFGYNKKELLKKPFDFPLEGGKTSEIEISHQGGEIAIAEMRVVDIDWEGEPAYLASLRDITESKRAAEALQESEEKFSKAFRSSPDSIAITTLEGGVFIEVNDSFTRFTGYTREEVIGSNSTELGLWAKAEDRLRMTKLLKEQGRVESEEFDIRTKSGEIRVWLFSAEPINIGGKPCIISVTVDITELKLAMERNREQNEFLNAVLESITNPFYVVDTNDYTIKMANSASKVGDLSKNQTCHATIFNESKPCGSTDRVCPLKELKEKQKPVVIEQAYRDENNNARYAEVHGYPIFDSEGNVIQMLEYRLDITERKLALEALAESEEFSTSLLENSPNPIVVINPDMSIKYVNQAFEKLTGFTSAEVNGNTIPCPWWPEESREEFGSIKIEDIDSGGSSTERIYQKKNGELFWVAMSLIPVRQQNGTLKYILSNWIDITERKEAEEKLRQIDQMKSEFLSNVSHELRTPLQSIGGFTKLLLRGEVPDPEAQQEFLQIIDRESQYLGNLINSLLDMSRLESGRFQINKKLTPVRDTIIDAVKIFQSLARDKDIALSEDIPAQLPEIEADGERLRQVVINLLGNAIKFSDPGGSVKVKAESRNGKLLFQVADQGTGIPEEAMPHLFERFYRAEDKLVRGGAGLGLYISKQIIEAHGGRIWAESQAGEGSTFSFALPLNGKGGNNRG